MQLRRSLLHSVSRETYLDQINKTTETTFASQFATPALKNASFLSCFSQLSANTFWLLGPGNTEQGKYRLTKVYPFFLSLIGHCYCEFFLKETTYLPAMLSI